MLTFQRLFGIVNLSIGIVNLSKGYPHFDLSHGKPVSENWGYIREIE